MASDVSVALAPAAPLLLDANAAAALCGLSRAKWFQLVRTGAVPAAIRTLGPRCPRWRRDDVERWIEAGCPRPDEGGRR